MVAVGQIWPMDHNLSTLQIRSKWKRARTTAWDKRCYVEVWQKTELLNSWFFASDFSVKYRTSINKRIQNPRVIKLLYMNSSHWLRWIVLQGSKRTYKQNLAHQPSLFYERFYRRAKESKNWKEANVSPTFKWKTIGLGNKSPGTRITIGMDSEYREEGVTLRKCLMAYHIPLIFFSERITGLV